MSKIGKEITPATSRTVVVPLRRVRKRLTWTHGDLAHYLWFTGCSNAVGVVFRGRRGWFWKSYDGRNTFLASEKPKRLDRALDECKAFIKRLIAIGALK